MRSASNLGKKLQKVPSSGISMLLLVSPSHVKGDGVPAVDDQDANLNKLQIGLLKVHGSFPLAWQQSHFSKQAFLLCVHISRLHLLIEAVANVSMMSLSA